MLWSGCWENKVKYIGGKFMKEYIYRIHLKPQNDKKENPFKFCGIIPNSEKVIEKILISYRHLLNNLQSGNLHF